MSQSVSRLTLEGLHWRMLGKFNANSRLPDERGRAPRRKAHLKLKE